ncbi:MAG: phosphoribosylamine--glycine ligase [Bacteroidetes bacterium]|nr:MAG: phosphoribosylamine--glycine ligase [Bacteroidota bacterium]
MTILILGSGGREHAFAWKVSQSPLCQKLFIAPGNAGTSAHGTNVTLNPSDFDAVRNFVLKNEVGMVIVGPEAPLVEGIYDYFQNDPSLRQIPVVGPSREGARLEGSKAFAKAFMSEFQIPTAAYREFTAAELDEGLAYIATQTPPIVLKADGLAAGKGVLICENIETAQTEFKAMLGGKFGRAGDKVVIEQFLDGIEFSVFVLTDGKDWKVLPVAKDYKRIGEGDTGLNTGGMGAVSPVPFVQDDLMQKVENQIIKPTIEGVQKRGFEYKGFIFLGLIRVGDSPFVIEYNCRMGDPETEVVLPRLKNDLVELFIALHEGRLGEIEIEQDPRAATTVMLVSGGYPEKYEKGKPISGLDKVEHSIIFHAGTREENGTILTNGGRVLAITSFGPDIKSALEQSKKNAEIIHFDGKYYRKDIGFDLPKN